MKSSVPEPLQQRFAGLLAHVRNNTGPERINAETLLKKLLDKHGLKLSDIESPETTVVYFDWRSAIEKDLLFQVILTVLNEAGSIKCFCKNRRCGFELTKVQAAECKGMYKFHRANLAKEQELLFRSYLHKHNIYPASGPYKTDYTPEELRELERIINMMQGLSDSTYQVTRKQLPRELGGE